ncbi:hypothetical protein GGR37_003148 [Novosphingobium taihuense]|uniref:Uncharacterized protein n=1 Tax=Novosphingobium taihuense TaxID=260085 RepID=A0A7W7AD71_9SPHN|nr:hypothetical protein [Novosphingobium taihuense]
MRFTGGQADGRCAHESIRTPDEPVGWRRQIASDDSAYEV